MANTPATMTVDQLLELASIEREATTRYGSSESYQAQLASRYRMYRALYEPDNGDQWPEDIALRPGKIHVTANIVKATVDINSRLQSILPRVTLPSTGMDEAQRARAEVTEQTMLTWLELSSDGWDVWLNNLCRVKSLYGKGVVKAWWNDDDKRGDASIIENPANLRIGWGASDFSVMDWALYEYSISPEQAMQRWSGIIIEKGKQRGQPPNVITSNDHADPLGQLNPKGLGPNKTNQPFTRQLSDYEMTQVRVWDYWYKHSDGTVCNAIMLQGRVVEGPYSHPEMPDIPYIPIENDHAPSDPEGISDVKVIVDTQAELNRLLSHGYQHVADDTDPAWYAKGEDSSGLLQGVVPKAGEITDAGNSDILPLQKSVNVNGIDVMIQATWDTFHRETGLPEILFGNLPGADSSGRALTVQVEAAANRLDPKRALLYRGLRQLLIFWTIMAERKNPKMEVAVDAQTGQTVTKNLGDVVKGFRRWKIVPPEITPRDSVENTQNAINQINAKAISLKAGMDMIGVDSPEAMIKEIIQERSDPHLFPADVQSYVSLLTILQQLQMTAQQAQQAAQQPAPGAPGAPGQGGPGGQSAVAQGQAAVNGVQNQQYGAQPQAVGPDQNQPITQAGSAPPAAGQGPAGPTGPVQQTLLRSGAPLNQINYGKIPV